ncbi:MAG: lasso peptide biosynthesis B2 protein [Pseudomonadota bacterium]
MRPLIWWRAWSRAQWRRRWLGLEAGAELVRARLLTLMPTRVYTRALGGLTGETAAVSADSAQQGLAEEIGEIVRTVAGAMPFRALCLQQVIAARRMLSRRNCRSVVVLGVRPENIRDAHAWLRVGSKVVSGDGDLERFSVIAEFR